jgi:uncharacterized protein (DUF1330 family)
MAAYVIAEIDIFDPATFEQYRSQDGPSIEKYGGKFIVRGGPTEKVEGDWDPKRVVIIEFGSMERARQWYYSPEYKAVINLRHRSAHTNLIFVEGV